MKKKVNVTEQFNKHYPNGILVDSVDLLFADDPQPVKNKRRPINTSLIKMILLGIGTFVLLGIMLIPQLI